MSTLTLDQRHTDAEFARIVDELTRRGFLAGGLGTAAGLGLLSACAGGGNTAQKAPATRVVHTVKGDITVPANPKRIIAINPGPLSTLYDLGVPALGVFDVGAQWVAPRYLSRWKSAQKIGKGDAIEFEKIASLEPDLILGVDYADDLKAYGRCSQVAPTVLVTLDSWQRTAQATADAVNRGDELAKLKSDLAGRLHQIKTTYADVLARYRWDLIQGQYDDVNYSVFSATASDIGQLYTLAGVKFASLSANAKERSTSLSTEKLDLLSDADVIAYFATYDGSDKPVAPLFASKLFKELPAAQAGRIVAVQDFLPSGYGDAQAALDSLEAELKQLAA